MTIKFYLDKPKAEVETAIYLFIRFGKATLKFNTGKKVHPEYWNSKNPESHFKRFTGSPEMNLWLNRLRDAVNVLYYSDAKLSVEDLKEQVTNLINEKAPQDTAKTFSTALTEFINSRESNKDHALSTIKKYKTLESHLKGYEAL